MKRFQGVVVIGTLSLVFVAAGCGGSSKSSGSDGSESTTSTTIGGTQLESHGIKDVANATGKVEIELDDYYFDPTILKGTPGQKVTLELKNEGENVHTLTIADQNVDQEVQPADEAEVDVTFPETGELTFVCRFHESNGMVGALEVSGGTSSTTTDESSTSSSDY